MLKVSRNFYNAAIIMSVFSVVVARLYDQHIDAIITDTVSPFVSVDVDKDGKPDIERIKAMRYSMFDMTFPVGHILYNTVMFTVKLAFIYWVSKQLIQTTRNHGIRR